MTKHQISKAVLFASASLPILLVSGLAWGQSSPPAEPATQVDDIVVTSRRTAERLQDVPLPITAFNERMIEDAGISNLDDVAQMTPGLTFYSPFGEQIPTPVIRGISQTNIFGETNAAVFVDGVYVSGRQGLNLSQLDIARIEVVKGPQSALYGRNSFSGAINIITAEPSDVFSGKGEVTVGDHGRRAARLSVSGPLIAEKLSGRLAVGYDHWDGAYDNTIEGGPNIGGSTYQTLLASLAAHPAPRLDLGASLYISHDEIDQAAVTSVLANCERSSAGASQTVCGEIAQAPVNAAFGAIRGATGDTRDLTKISLTGEWRGDFLTVNTLTGLSDLTYESVTDGSRTPTGSTLFLYEKTGGPPFRLGAFPVEMLRIARPVEVQEFSQEIRVSTPQDRRVRGSVGGFYYEVETTTGDVGVQALTPKPADFNSFAPNIRLPFPPFAVVAPVGNLAFGGWFNGTDVDPNANSRTDTKGWALFGSVEGDLTSQLTARAELRYAHDEQSFVSPAGVAQSDDRKAVTSRFTLDWRARDGMLVYATAARGAKPGGISYDVQSARITSYDPETLWNYELGLKTTSADRRFTSDLSIYYIDWQDILIPQIYTPAPPALPYAVETNAGSASVYGAELQSQMRWTPTFTTSLGVSYNDARFDEAVLATYAAFPSYAATGGDVSGNQLAQTSKWQANGSFTYERDLTADWRWTLRGDAFYRTKQFNGADNLSWVPSRGTVNLRTGLRSDRWTIEAFVDNLFDDVKPTGAFRDVAFTNTADGANVTFFPWRMSVSYSPGRTAGLVVRARF